MMTQTVHDIPMTVPIVLVTVLIIGCITYLAYVKEEPMTASQNMTLTNEECCPNGYYCTDVYYEPDTNQCHLILCESPMNKVVPTTKCTYAGKTDLRVMA